MTDETTDDDNGSTEHEQCGQDEHGTGERAASSHIPVPEPGVWETAAGHDEVDMTFPEAMPVRAFAHVIQGIGLAASMSIQHGSHGDAFLCQELQTKILAENPEATKKLVEHSGGDIGVAGAAGVGLEQVLDGIGIDTDDIDFDFAAQRQKRQQGGSGHPHAGHGCALDPTTGTDPPDGVTGPAHPHQRHAPEESTDGGDGDDDDDDEGFEPIELD